MEVHDPRSREVDVDPRAPIPTTPHVQSEGLGRVTLHLPSKRGGKTKTATRRPAQPDEELAGLVSNMAFHRKRHHWQGRSRRAAPSSSSPSTTTSAPASP